MATKNAPGAEQLDMKEVLSSVDAASGLFGHAQESFADIAVLFKAIAAASGSNSLAGRLSRLGEDLCGELGGDFEQYQCDFNELTCRYTSEMAGSAEASNGD
ncbi:hypothetical protein [Paraburkholderia sp.]|uniref:hypothetical protein n=1 Tax=Paraburkholderia sp. TaxID=1926495 RepID=UPI003C7E64CD